MRYNTLLWRAFPVAALVLAAGHAPAALDGRISGAVKDATGLPLPGVTVSVTGPVLQGSRSVVTKTDGTFFVPNLPPGKGYAVAFELAGFKKLERVNQEVTLSNDTQVNATLQVADVTTEVVVTGEAPVVDVTRTNTAQNFNESYLSKASIGSAGRSYQSVLRQVPGAVDAGSGNPNVLGGNILENNYSIDGINTTDAVTHTFTFNLNFDAIQEVSVLTSSFDAEYGRASGGVVNVVTKSGGNEFHGGLDIRHSTNSFAESGDHFDPSLSETRNTPWSAVLGGPVAKDRLWFFGNIQRPDNFAAPVVTSPFVTAAGYEPPTRGFKGWNSGLKLTFTAIPELSGFVEVQDALATITNTENSQFIRPEASGTKRQRSRLYSSKLNGVFNASWLAELQVGRAENHLETSPVDGDISVSRSVNRLTNISYDNYNNYQNSERNRNLLGLSSTYYLGNAIGNHQIKVGADLERTEFPSTNITTGTPSDPSFCPAGLVCGATFRFNGFDAAGNRIPFSQTVVERLPLLERKGRSYSAFLQDQWRPTPQLTVNLGARWDRNEYVNNLGEVPVTFDKVQPRLGVAYDLVGDGKNVVRGFYGQFYVDAALTFARLFDTGINSQVQRAYSWSASQRKYVLVQQAGGNPQTEALVDGPLKPTYDDQVNISFQRELFKGASATATYIYKRTNDIIEDTCKEQATCNDFWLTNQPGRDVGVTDALKKDYFGYQLQLQYAAGRYLVNASYVYSKSRGSVDSSAGQYAGADFDVYPDSFANRYGYMADDARHRFRVFGSYQIPFVEARLGVNYTYRTGVPWTDDAGNPVGHTATGIGYVYDEPRGESRTPVAHQLDLELEKAFTLPGGISISLIGDVFNLNNSEQANTYDTNTASATFGTPTGYQRPRRYEVGLRVGF